jgi:hypothetical protein
VREIRTLRAMWRALETEPRQLLNGHEEGNLGYKPRRNLRATAPALDPTWWRRSSTALGIVPIPATSRLPGGGGARGPLCARKPWLGI